MPLYKSGIDMYKKYVAKYNPEVVSTRFTDVESVAKDRANEGLGSIATVRNLVRPILDEYGVTGGLRATYLAFATKLAKHGFRQGADSMTKIATALKSYFVSAYDLDADICDEIIQVVVGWAIAY